MPLQRVEDWDNAYNNGGNIPRSERWPEAWIGPAATIRASLGHRALLDQSYGPHERHRFDLFLPEGEQQGVVVFVHGGYWRRFDKSYWSHLAAGPLAHGYAVAMPSYRLCPEVSIGEIGRDVAAAIAAAAARVDGPIHLTGHSAGGHLVARMIADPSPLAPEVLARVRNVVPLSGLPDLRPLMRTEMNLDLKIDEAEAMRESPALLRPVSGARLIAWVGGAERAEFRRQNALLANIWLGLGAQTIAIEALDRHHFDVIDDLANSESGLVEMLLG